MPPDFIISEMESALVETTGNFVSFVIPVASRIDFFNYFLHGTELYCDSSSDYHTALPFIHLAFLLNLELVTFLLRAAFSLIAAAGLPLKCLIASAAQIRPLQLNEFIECRDGKKREIEMQK